MNKITKQIKGVKGRGRPVKQLQTSINTGSNLSGSGSYDAIILHTDEGYVSVAGIIEGGKARKPVIAYKISDRDFSNHCAALGFLKYKSKQGTEFYTLPKYFEKLEAIL